MRDLPNFGVWFLQFLLGLALAGSVVYYGFFHIHLKFPLHALLAPWLAGSLLLAGAAPIIYWAVKYGRRSGGDMRPLFTVIAATMMVFCPIMYYYASKLGMLTVEAARGHCPAILLKVGLRVLRITVNSSGVSLFTSQDKAAKDVLTLRRVDAAREAAEVAAQMAEEALGQVGGAQPMPPARRPAQVGQDAVEFSLEFLHHPGRPEAPAAVRIAGRNLSGAARRAGGSVEVHPKMTNTVGRIVRRVIHSPLEVPSPWR